MKIQIGNQQTKIQLTQQIEQTVNSVIEEVAKVFALQDNNEVSVTFLDNEEIAKLNLAYRNLDKPTDVLSFAFDEAQSDITFEEESELHLLGDIVISLEKATEQANEYGHDLIREVAFLTVHGMLHLLGYDHIEKEDELEMRKLEEETLLKLKLGR